MGSGYFDFTLPTKVVFGPGKIEALPAAAELSRSGFRRAVIITDKGVEKAGLLDKPCTSLKHQGVKVEVFTEVRANPDLQSVKECLQFLKGHKPDCIIAIGRGSSLDTSHSPPFTAHPCVISDGV